MKTSEFILSTTGLLTTCYLGQLLPAILFGVLAYISFRRLMASLEVQEPEEEQLEGGMEPWESITKKIWRKEVKEE